MHVITTNNLSRRFRKVEAVKNLTLSVEAGTVYAFLGPNGAGKTTTIKLLMNLLRPDSGEARVLDTPSLELGPAQFRQIGYVSENQKQPEWMTVGGFLDFCRPLYPTWDRDLEKKLLRQFDLPLDRRLSKLSRGMKMKAVLLSSLAYRPRLLVLDEPFSGLDPLVREEFVGGLLEITEREGWTIFLSSHDMAEVERLADTVGVIHDGRLRISESVDTLENRFRRVSVENFTSSGIPLPAHYLAVETDATRLRFVDSQWPEDESGVAALNTKYPEAQITLVPLGLRDILVTLLAAYKIQ